jgi:hypothetical protein
MSGLDISGVTRLPPPSPAAPPASRGARFVAPARLPTDDAYFDCSTVHSIAEPTETQP